LGQANRFMDAALIRPASMRRFGRPTADCRGAPEVTSYEGDSQQRVWRLG